MSDREWFRHVMEGHKSLYIGRALRGRTVHNIFFPIVRPILGPDGKFRGAVQVGVEVSEMAEIFGQIELGQGGQLALYRVQDGAIVASHPMAQAQLDESIATLPFFTEIAHSQDETWTGVVHMGDQDHILSVRRAQNLPLIVLASTLKAHAYAGAWYRLL